MKFSLLHLPTYYPELHGSAAMGVTNISPLVNFGGLASDKTLTSMERFAQHVMPRLQ